ncbi:uncharacterized protein CDAR_167491 [Caerostris darwini]|uniref:Uncharacterized protein n=1 Tax=Caerostris darwini TaxID=1538125 RepID=A0AAV4NFY1_9ARAC|nr:uncharacterized protein CDAR_167491 [Caerostris darwini]
MAPKPATFQFFAVILIAAAVSSFTLVYAEESSKDEQPSKDVAASDDTNAQDDSKEKRSQEEIMFGNQQNKPNGLVDDLMEMSGNADEEDSNSAFSQDKKSNDSQGEEQSSNDEAKDSKDEKRAPGAEEDQNDMMMGSGADNWYNSISVSPSAMQYLANSQARKLPSEEFSNSLYDQEDLYRRKRQLLDRPLPLRKRSLRSSIGQMIQKRGIRLPRRSMRLKRQVDMEDLINLFGNDRFYDDEAQIPGRFSGYPETPAPEYRYPYVFQHRDLSILNPGNEMEDNNEALEGDNMEDVDNLMLMPPNSRYAEMEGYGSRGDDEKEAIQSWLNRHTVPSVFRVSRRSAPYFYPIDYRYIPGYKKRSRLFSNGNRDLGRFSGDEEPESEFGKWGHVVQVPEAYASPEDVARLYGLASLMAEEEEPEVRVRRAA